MTMKIKCICLLLFLGFTQTLAWAQNDKILKKAESKLSEKNYSKALQLSEKALKTESKDPKALMVKSQALYYLYKNPKTAKKYSSGLKESLRAAEKAVSTEQGSTVKVVYADFLNLLILENNKEGNTALNLERYPKATQHFKLSLDFNPNDTAALFKLGECYWNTNNRLKALYYFKKVAQWNLSAFSDSVSLQTIEFKSFRYLAQHYMNEKEWDSASMYLQMGLEIFPNDYILKGHKYGLYRVKSQDLPPSFDYLDYVNQALKEYPQDSFFRFKQNSLFIFLFKQSLKENNTKQADSLLGQFILDKIGRKESYKHFDYFEDSEPEKVFANLMNYASGYYHKDIFNWIFPKWVSENTVKDQLQEIDFIQAANNLMDSKQKASALLALQYIYVNYNSIKVEEILKDWHINKKMNMIALDYASDISKNMYLKSKANAQTVLYKKIKSDFVDSLAFNNFMFRAKTVLTELEKEFPNEKLKWDTIYHKTIAELDFYYNYYQTRMVLPNSKDSNALVFEHTMDYKNCEIGTISTPIYEALVARINYFRRNSGVQKPIYFVNDLNLRCQHAALIFESNKNLTHKVVDGLRCYTSLGQEGAAQSLLIKTTNPAIAVTAIMGDKHPSQGNRRWLQFPYTMNMGYGGGTTSQVFWIMDQGASADSNYYKTNFVAWPNKGYTPSVLAFEKWSFSLLAELEGAKVSVKDEKGKEIPVVLEKIELGYGLPTLVFTPQFNEGKPNLLTAYKVIIQLKDKKTFSYIVRFFEPKLVK